MWDSEISYDDGIVLCYHALRCGLDIPPQARVLEIGCGDGRMMERLAPEVELLVGVDISEAMVRRANARLYFWHHARAVLGNGWSLPVEARAHRYDCIYSLLTLQHNPPDVVRRLLREAHAVAAEGCVLRVQFYTGPESPRNWPPCYPLSETAVLDMVRSTRWRVTRVDRRLVLDSWLWITARA